MQRAAKVWRLRLPRVTMRRMSAMSLAPPVAVLFSGGLDSAVLVGHLLSSGRTVQRIGPQSSISTAVTAARVLVYTAPSTCVTTIRDPVISARPATRISENGANCDLSTTIVTPSSIRRSTVRRFGWQRTRTSNKSHGCTRHGERRSRPSPLQAMNASSSQNHFKPS